MKVCNYKEGELALGIVDNSYRDLDTKEIENLPNHIFYSVEKGEVIESGNQFPKYKEKWEAGD